VALVRTDVSDDGVTSIIKVNGISELKTKLAITSNGSTFSIHHQDEKISELGTTLTVISN
jgi:hypothetical protein